ncbi:MAG TPA: pseudouridine synthase [Treponemataceae bacterium]|nr:pseudouridine synthase [Treponemataceae bacterium]
MDNTLKDRLYYNQAGLMVYYKMPGDICESWHEGAKAHKENYVTQQLLSAYTGIKYCECCHRLDRPVSGLVVVSRKPELIAPTQKALASTNACKTYYAIVEGLIQESNSFEILEHTLLYNAKIQKTFVNKNNPNAKRARLRWRSIGHGERYSFIEIQLLTGYTHQIRCQLATAGMNIKGDLKYGARRSDTISGIRLYAGKLTFEHPVTKKNVHIVAPPPVMDGLWTAAWISSGMRTSLPAERYTCVK